AEHHAADATETINTDFNSHCCLSLRNVLRSTKRIRHGPHCQRQCLQSEDFLYQLDDVFRRETEVLEEHARRRGSAEAIQTENPPFGTGVFVPEIRRSCLDYYAFYH